MAVSWITTDEVATAIGLEPAAGEDSAFLESVTAAAQDWAFDQRKAAGYVDPVDVVPSPRVKAGTVLYAVALYRERGSVDSFASFSEMPTSAPFGSMAQINRLLGLRRPVVA